MATDKALLALFNDILNYLTASGNKLYLEITNGSETDERFDRNKANYHDWAKTIPACLVDYQLFKACDIITDCKLTPVGTIIIKAHNYIFEPGHVMTVQFFAHNVNIWSLLHVVIINDHSGISFDNYRLNW